ncbi:uncharacterized protein LOC142591669 isoform X2 [Dermacentor variabilis]|uniref:uncharacterized protein LOC142591669 isoform X2 n=1 Tax=Dermacentor variabilis TaxID=34621 RepID=UPI003F5BA65D
MKSFLVAVFFAIICLQLHDCEALVSETARASGTTNKCLTITLPNFLGIGACTKSYSNLCTPGSVGITGLVQRILECFVNGMLNFDLPTQIYLFIEFLKELFQETDPIPEILGGFCETLSSFTGVIGIDLDCNLLQLDTQALCEDKIQLTVPATLNLTECFGQVPFTCIKGKVLTEPLLKGFTVLVADDARKGPQEVTAESVHRCNGGLPVPKPCPRGIFQGKVHMAQVIPRGPLI